MIAKIKIQEERFRKTVSRLGISKALKYKDRKRAKKRQKTSPIKRIIGSLLLVTPMFAKNEFRSFGRWIRVSIHLIVKVKKGESEIWYLATKRYAGEKTEPHPFSSLRA